MRSGPGAARTILFFHIFSARPSKQPLITVHTSLTVHTFLKVYMELGSYFLFLQEHHHPDPAVGAHCAFAAAVAAVEPLAVMLADAEAPAVLAGVPMAVMLEVAPAVLAPAPAAGMLAPPQSLHSLLRRLCSQMPAPLPAWQSLQMLLKRL